jgi:chaperonin cofactor prefoldin
VENKPVPKTRTLALEQDAEVLVTYQLDLLAQVEAQLRAVHHTMRAIEKLRGGHAHVGPELTKGEQQHMLKGLSVELESLEQQIETQHECCRDMQRTIKKMQSRFTKFKHVAGRMARTDSAGPEEQTLR